MKLVILLNLILSMHLCFGEERKPFDPYQDINGKKVIKKRPANVDTIQSPTINLNDFFFGNSIQGITGAIGNSDELVITNREDSEYKYIDIKADGINKENLNISVKDETVSIQGQIKKIVREDEKDKNSQIISSFTSSFMRSFSVPDGVDSTNPVFDMTGEVIVIKFKKK